MRVAIAVLLSLLAGQARAADPVDDLLDRGLTALARGDLAEAERDFALAGSVPGEPTRQALAESFAVRVHALRVQGNRPGSASVPFVVTTTVLGFALYGWSLPLAMGVDLQVQPRAFIGAYMIGAAASFVLPFWLTREHRVTPAEANLAFYGGTRGAWHGVLLGSVLGGDISSDSHPRVWAGAMALGSLLELAGGFRLASALDLSPGQVRTMAALGDLGLLEGFGAGYLLRFDEKATVDARSRGMAAAGLAGAGLGLTGGYLLGQHRHHSWGDGEVLRMASGVGAWLGVGLADLAHVSLDPGNATFTALAMAGGLAGAVAGDFLVRDTALTVSNSLIIDLATVAGGLLGAGGLFIATKGDRDIAFASALGGALGFGLSYWASPRSVLRNSELPAISLAPLVLPGARGLAIAGPF
jgi:hypothetical protein